MEGEMQKTENKIDCSNDTAVIPPKTTVVRLYIGKGCAEVSDNKQQLTTEQYTVTAKNIIQVQKSVIKEVYKALIGKDIQNNTQVRIVSSTNMTGQDRELATDLSTQQMRFKDLQDDQDFQFEDSADYNTAVDFNKDREQTSFTLHFTLT